jgi:hypothetical protein
MTLVGVFSMLSVPHLASRSPPRRSFGVEKMRPRPGLAAKAESATQDLRTSGPQDPRLVFTSTFCSMIIAVGVSFGVMHSIVQ